MTNRERILIVLKKSSFSMTCAKICYTMLYYSIIENISLKQLNSSISGELNKMIKDDVLEYDNTSKGPRGGYKYKLKNNYNETTKP